MIGNPLAPILTAKASTGIGAPQLVENFDHLALAVDLAGTPTLTVKFQGSVQEAMPDFAAAQSASNQWDYIQVKDLEDGSAIDGDTGLAPAGSNDHRLFEMNVSGLRWICAVVTAYTAGAITVSVKPFRVM